MTLILGDCLEVMRTMADKSVQCCVTSPPYFGLRDYGTAKWDGGDAGCDHKQTTARHDGGRVNTNGFHGSSKDDSDKGEMNYRNTCAKCGAIRIDDQIGLEESPEAYVAKLVDVFREVRRVLRDDGVLWLNLGDSYCNTNGYARASEKWQRDGRNDAPANDRNLNALHEEGYKTKDLLGIPWRVAFALQADGWWLRQDIIWAKPNPMPESVTDRCTKSNEYIFLLTKSARYYYDADAVKEAAAGGREIFSPSGFKANNNSDRNDNGSKNLNICTSRNLRDVWTITTKPYKESHFATFPIEIPTRCIMAGSKIGDTILDPFNGAGTTGVACVNLGREFIGIDLNSDYIRLAERRIAEAGQQMRLNL
jgi:DNA modification methylase